MKIIEKLRVINPWHFLWIAVVCAEISTALITTVQGYVFWGHIPEKGYYIIGGIDSLFVPLLVIPMIIAFVAQISRLKQELASRREASEKIRVLAYYDSLTNLPNRLFFQKLLDRAIEFAARHGHSLAVLFIDLDFFKRINDTLGHSEGDKLLQLVTERLLKSTRSSDDVARWDSNEVTNVMSRLGGDEFILLLHSVSNPHDAGNVARRVLQDIAEPFSLDGREVYVTASIGISMYPTDGRNVDDILKNADVAMYHAKTRGRNNYQYYTATMTEAAINNLTLRNMLYKGLDNDEFLLHYQPRRSISKDRLVGMEALLRWKPVSTGLVPPSEFVSLMEETGLITRVGEWVLRQACLQNKAWHVAGYGPLVVSVNLSSRQFDEDLVDIVSSALREADLKPEFLELEVTESTIMIDPDAAVTILHELKSMGVKVSIDDFGTGYSSLNYLRQLPLDFLKIDRSFVKNIAINKSDEAIIKTVVTLAHSLDLEVVAEGVETEEQLTFLSKCGCDEIQGFLLSPPLPPEEFQKGLLKGMA